MQSFQSYNTAFRFRLQEALLWKKARKTGSEIVEAVQHGAVFPDGRTDTKKEA